MNENSSYLRDAWATVLVAMRVRNIHRGDLAESLNLHRNTVGNYLQDPTGLGTMTVTNYMQLMKALKINPRTLEHEADSQKQH